MESCRKCRKDRSGENSEVFIIHCSRWHRECSQMIEDKMIEGKMVGRALYNAGLFRFF